MLFHKKRNQASMPKIYPYGYECSQKEQTTSLNKVQTCALKGLLIFAACFGTIGSMISSFELPCNLLVIAVFLFISSMLLAFLHYNKLLFNFCYPVVFIVFSFSIFTYRYEVNSGFQAFLSILQEKYSDYFDLSILREATEYFTDRSFTITFAAIFIGFFLIVLLNIAISEYMSLLGVFFLTFPLFQLGIYINKLPSFLYMTLLIFSYFVVGILKRSRHFLLPYREKIQSEYSCKTKNNVTIHRYYANGKVMFQLSALFFAFSLILGVLFLPFLNNKTADQNYGFRKLVNDYVKIFVQNGISGFFNRYEATGGISEGKLGGVSSIRPDYQTDLELTFVPYSYESLYLKAFTGAFYTGNSWEKPDYEISTYRKQLGDNYDNYESFTAFLESKRLQYYMDNHVNSGIYGKMRITNLGANSNCIYLPYYTDDNLEIQHTIEQGIVNGTFPLGDSYDLNYYPLLHDYWNIHLQPDELLSSYDVTNPEYDYIMFYNMYNNSHYLEIPYNTQLYIDSIKNDIGYSEDINEQIALIQKYLSNNYTYSMTPGNTPYDQDFVQYFLEKQKKGYCAHFASAAVLLLRSYNIPARYVEGYSVSFLEVSEGTPVNEPYDDWFTGTNPIEKSGVVTVEVSDADAHAWVEVYKNGMGWIPYDFTPASSEDQDTAQSDFWRMFSGMFGNAPSYQASDPSQYDDSNSISSKINRFLGSSSFVLAPLIFFVILLLIACSMLMLGRRIVSNFLLYSKYRHDLYEPLVSDRYRKICILLKKKSILNDIFILPTDFYQLDLTEKLILKKEGPSAEAIKQAMELLEKCCYSKSGISRLEADQLLQFLTKYFKFIKHSKIKKEKKCNYKMSNKRMFK